MRNNCFFLLVLTTIISVLSACAPASPGAQTQATPVTDSPPTQAEPMETPVDPTPEPTASSEMTEVPLIVKEPYLLVGTWKGKGEQVAGSIYPVDPATGEPLPGYEPVVLRENGYVHEFSADRKRLAVVVFGGQSCDSISGGSRCRGGQGELYLIDLPDWVIVSAPLPVDGYVHPLAFSPDAGRLALAASSREGVDLVIVDGNSGETVAQRDIEFPPERLAFTADGSSLVVYGTPLNEPAGMAQPEPPVAAVLDAASLETRWEQSLPEVTSGSWCLENCDSSHELVLFANYLPGTALSPDGQRLYIAHAGEDRLTTVDFAAQEVRTADIAEATSWFERLLALTAGVAQAKGGMEGAIKQAALSSDGSVLYTAGQAMHAEPDEQAGWHIEQESFPVQAIDPETGRLLARYTPGRQGSYGLRPSTDGETLLLEGWEGNLHWTEILDAESLEPVAKVKGWELRAVQGPDGNLTWLGSRPGPSQTTLAVLDPETFEPLAAWKEFGFWLTP